MNSLNAANGNSQTQSQTQQQQTQGQQPNQFKELQEIVQSTLEKQGILAKAQAQLRKHVFEALCFTEQQNKKFQNVSPNIDENNVNDRFAMALIRDFLSYHQLDYTLSLMNTESQKKLEKTQDITRNEIASRLGLGAQKPNPSCSLLHLVVRKLFDVDVLKPRNSTLNDNVKLKPRASNDSYRSTLDSLSISKDTIEFQQKKSSPKFQSKSPPTQKYIPKQPALNAESDDAKDNNDNDRNDSDLNDIATNPLDNLTLKMAVSNNLPPIPSNKATNEVEDGIKKFIEEEPEVDISILSDTTKETMEDKEEEETNDDNDKINIDDALDELLDSSSNNGQEAEEADDDIEEEELRRIEQMNKTMEQLRQQTSEFEKLKKESISPSIGTEYDDEDFGTDEDINSNIESVITKDTLNINDDDEDEDDIEIEEDIDEDIEIDEEEIESQPISNDNDDDEISNTDNIYSAKDDKLAADVKLENVADIIMDVQTQKIDFKL